MKSAEVALEEIHIPLCMPVKDMLKLIQYSVNLLVDQMWDYQVNNPAMFLAVFSVKKRGDFITEEAPVELQNAIEFFGSLYNYLEYRGQHEIVNNQMLVIEREDPNEEGTVGIFRHENVVALIKIGYLTTTLEISEFLATRDSLADTTRRQ